MENMRAIMRRFCIALNNILRTYYKVSAKGSEIWLFYVLDDGGSYSQKQICEEWGFPRTSLNAVVKNAVSNGYITLVPIPGKRREMNIRLTEAGTAYAEEILSPIYRAEDEAMQKALTRDTANFVEALEYFDMCMQAIFNRESNCKIEG